MNRQQQIEHYEEIQQYLQQNNIYGLFGQLVQQLILEKPKEILDCLIQKLESPEKFTLFVVGPPGLSINTIIKKALAYTDKQYELFNCGEEITKIKEQLNEDNKKKFTSCLLVEDTAIQGVVNKIESFLKSEKNYIIEGFPKNLKEALILQRRGIHAKNILLINIDDNGLQSILQPKIRQLNQNLSQHERERVLQVAMMEHKINIRAVKQFYNKYLEIDLSNNRQENFIVQQLTKAFTIKNISAIPRTSSQIIIVGAPFSGRTTLGTKIAEHYNFVYISTSFLIAEEIRRDTIHGRKIKSQYISNQLIDNFLIEKLIEERISKKDCKMQGFVLQGYPKNKQQFQNVKSMKLAPTLIVAIDTPSDISKKRSEQDEGRFNSRYEKWKHFAGFLRESKQKIFWVDPKLSIGNLYEEVVHQFQKQFT